MFEETFYDKINSVVGDLEETERIADSKESCSYEYRNYSGPKIRKLHLGGVVFRPPAPEVRTSTCGIHPAYDYDFPRFGCLWSERKDKTLLIVDLHPVRDIVLYPDYVEKYLKPLHPLAKDALEIPGMEKEVRMPHPRSYWLSAQFSKYFIRGRFPVEQTGKAWDLALKYFDVWLEGWKKGEPIQDPEEKKMNQKRLEMMSEAYRILDPGARLWISVGGEQLAKEMQEFSW